MKKKGNPIWIGIGLVLGISIGSAFGNVALGVPFGLVIGAVVFLTAKTHSVEEEKDNDSSVETESTE